MGQKSGDFTADYAAPQTRRKNPPHPGARIAAALNTCRLLKLSNSYGYTYVNRRSGILDEHPGAAGAAAHTPRIERTPERSWGNPPVSPAYSATMNVANAITILRLILIPVFVALILIYRPEAGMEGVRIAAFVVFIVAAVSDGIDGFVARRFNQQTRLGAVLDPLADKLLVNIAFVFLAVIPSFHTQVPKWLPVIVLGRDITIASGSYLLNRYMGPLKPRPRVLGKIATIAHSVGIAAVVINLPHAFDVLMVMAAISVFSLADYLFHGYEEALPEERRSPGPA